MKYLAIPHFLDSVEYSRRCGDLLFQKGLGKCQTINITFSVNIIPIAPTQFLVDKNKRDISDSAQNAILVNSGRWTEHGRHCGVRVCLNTLWDWVSQRDSEQGDISTRCYYNWLFCERIGGFSLFVFVLFYWTQGFLHTKCSTMSYIPSPSHLFLNAPIIFSVRVV
jgi:hypothetical protein